MYLFDFLRSKVKVRVTPSFSCGEGDLSNRSLFLSFLFLQINKVNFKNVIPRRQAATESTWHIHFHRPALDWQAVNLFTARLYEGSDKAFFRVTDQSPSLETASADTSSVISHWLSLLYVEY